MRTQIPNTNTNLDLTNIDHVPSGGTLSGSNAMLYVFEDNEAVINMVIEGRSPTTRHVSRTHRVALDWLFDRINAGSKIQIRCIDTKHQLADILTKGNFTRDEWNNLLHLFNISHFSSTCCAQNSSLISCTKTMAKRMQEQKGEERSVAKSKSTAMNLSSDVPTCSSSAKKTDCIQMSGDTHSYGQACKQDEKKFKIRRSVEFSGATARCILGGLMDTATEKLVATNEESGDVDLSESENGSEEDVTGKPVACETATEKRYAFSKSDCQRSPKAERTECPHNLHVSPATIHHKEAVFSIVRRIYGRQLANLRFVKNHLWNSVRQLFNEAGKVIKEQTEITGVSTTGFKDATWMSTSLLCEKAYRITNIKT